MTNAATDAHSLMSDWSIFVADVIVKQAKNKAAES
jgi:hypothetical protein